MGETLEKRFIPISITIIIQFLLLLIIPWFISWKIGLTILSLVGYIIILFKVGNGIGLHDIILVSTFILLAIIPTFILTIFQKKSKPEPT